MSTKIDVHVHIIPPWARSDDAINQLCGESQNLVKAFNIASTKGINQKCSPEIVLQAMDKFEVDQAICFSYQWQDTQRCISANEYISQIVAEHPDRLLGLAVVQPQSATAADDLSRFLDKPGIIGLKIKPKWAGVSLADIPLMGPLCEELISRNGILLTHISQGFHHSAGDSVADLFTLLNSFPKLTVIAAHMAGFIGVYECYSPVKKYLDNLYVDISLPCNLAWLPHLMRLGDPHRYLYATDFPYISYVEFDRLLDSAGLTDREKEMLCWENPMRLLSNIG